MNTLLKSAAIKLSVSKAKIKDMIKNKKIGYELINGNYYVDIDEVEIQLNKKSTPKYLMGLDKDMSFILKETLVDFKYSNINTNSKIIKTLKKINSNQYVSNIDELEYLVGYYSATLMNGYNLYPTEFVKWFNIKTSSDFKNYRNYYFHTNRDISIYFEHFIMFDRLANGRITIINETSIWLEEVKNFHLQQSA